MKRLASQTIGRRARRGLRAATPFLALALVLVLVGAGGCNKNSADVIFPPEPPAPAMPWFYGVFGTAADNVYVAGESGVMYHWDGANWALQDLGTSQAVSTIWGPGDGTLLLCGDGGLIMRNTGGGWSSMDSGTTEDLYGLGNFQGDVYAVGNHGVMRKFSGGSWQGAPTTAVIRNAQQNFAPADTLDLTKDIASLVTVNYYGIGGAYHLPDWKPTDLGRKNTDGMFLSKDAPPADMPSFPWELRPRRGDQLAESEWVYCSTSDDLELSNNYMGTSEGWLFQLKNDDNNPGRLIWDQFDTRMTEGRNLGIRAMWLAANGDLYMVTGGGRIVYRSTAGVTRVLYDQVDSLVGIWGMSPSEFWVTGYMDNMILRCSYDPDTDTFTSVPVVLEFP